MRKTMTSFVFSLLLLAVISLSITDASSVTVPKQTPVQAEQWSRLAALAETASTAATPALLDYLSSSEFRSGVSNLPFAEQSSEDILALIGPVIVGSTITHGVPAGNVTLLDVGVQGLFHLNFIPNTWEMLALGLANLNDLPSSDLSVLQWIDNAEQSLFGLEAFSGNGTGKYYNISLTEAASRVGYAALNMWQLSDGIQLFGPVNFVLNLDYVRNISVLSPVDTGMYTNCCLEKQALCPFYNRTCPAITLGTFDHYNHLLLDSIQRNYWDYTLPQLLQRVFADPTPNATLFDSIYYWEVDVLGNIVFPDAISYVIADFFTLFGSGEGLELQSWCQQQNWTLVWAYGFFNVSTTPSLSEFFLKGAVTQAILDVSTTSLLGYPASSNVTSLFLEQWKVANVTRQEISQQQPSKSVAEAMWDAVWEKTYDLLPGSYHLHRPTTFVSTCSTANCIGTNDSGECLCYTN